MNNQNMNGKGMPDMNLVYPEIFYKLQPLIMNLCDQMDMMNSTAAPDQKMIDQITENIYNDMLEMYPDFVEYAREYEKTKGTEQTISEVIAINPRIYRRNFRRRGLLRDLIDILFLSEYHRRRRRY